MSYHIFVVDDDPSILDLMTLLLENEGYTVEAFESPPQALKAAVKEPPDAAIVDLMMPEMNGLDLLKALRINSPTRDVPVLVCSAYYENLLQSEAELQRMNVVRLRKPFKIDDLLEVVARMVGQKKRRGGARRKSTGGFDRIASFAA